MACVAIFTKKTTVDGGATDKPSNRTATETVAGFSTSQRSLLDKYCERMLALETQQPGQTQYESLQGILAFSSLC
ncbi:hypothetical protein Plhal304r1_c004g0015391 [Plasmopara halstedii]